MPRILIVEDNATFRQSFKEILRSQFPYLEIVEAVDGEDAIQRISAFNVDLIFMDIKLPGENGLSVTKKIKTDHPDIIVVILTSYDLPEYREAAQQSKADYFITKGSPTGKILAVVKSVLEAPKENTQI